MVAVGADGVDYSWGRPDPQELKRLGYQFVMRYLSYDLSGKNLTASERDQLFDAGLEIGFNWENDAGDARLGYDKGRQYAQEALKQARALGLPDSKPIYFSVDFDVQSSEYDVVEDYYLGIQSVIGRNRTGIYGSYNCIGQAKSRGWALYYWQTYAWSDGKIQSGIHVYQYQNNVTVAGASVDKNDAKSTDIGSWNGKEAEEMYTMALVQDAATGKYWLSAGMLWRREVPDSDVSDVKYWLGTARLNAANTATTESVGKIAAFGTDIASLKTPPSTVVMPAVFTFTGNAEAEPGTEGAQSSSGFFNREQGEGEP